MLQRCFVWNQWCWTGLCCLRLTVLSLSRCSLCWSFRTCILVILTHVKLHCRYPGQKKKPNFSKRNISTRLLGILSSSDLALSDTKKKPHQTPTQKPTHQNPEQGVDMFIFVPWFPSLKRMCLSSAGVTDADTNCNFYVSDVCSYKYCFSKLQPIGSKCSEPKWMWLVKHHWVPNMGRQQPVACHAWMSAETWRPVCGFLHQVPSSGMLLHLWHLQKCCSRCGCTCRREQEHFHQVTSTHHVLPFSSRPLAWAWRAGSN